MDPVTHGITGALLSEAGMAQKLGGRARWVLPVLAMIPDIDILYRLNGLPAYIENHRALSHSFLGIGIFGGLIGSILGRLDEERRYLAWIAAAWVALLSHQILDLITSYGTVVFYPFNHTRYFFDWLFIIDVFLTGILLISWLVAQNNRERGPSRARRGIIIALGYIAVCAITHQFMLYRLKQIAVENRISYQRIAAVPQLLAPLRWSGIVDVGSYYYQLSFTPLDGSSTGFQVYTRTTGSLWEQKAWETDLGALYRWFARYPVVREFHENGYHTVEFSDLRFYSKILWFPVRKPFVLQIKMDRQGNIIESKFLRI